MARTGCKAGVENMCRPFLCTGRGCSAKRNKCNFDNRMWLPVLLGLAMVLAPCTRAQNKFENPESKTATSSEDEAQKKNIQAYIDLMRKDVRHQKAEIMGAVMVLSASDAAKFWPIYSEYDSQLTELNNQRVQNIKQYARDYDQMTDQEADQLVQKAFAYQKERAELLGQTSEKVKKALGAITAARFAQVEHHQLLLITDLQIASSLTVVGQGS